MLLQYHEPSSLPTDYALVSQFQSPGEERTNDINDTDSELHCDENDNYTQRTGEELTNRFRRLTSASSRERPLLPPLLERDASYAGTTNPAFPDEQTPLLVQVPRIDENDDRDRPTLWKEFQILFRYTLPVLG